MATSSSCSSFKTTTVNVIFLFVTLSTINISTANGRFTSIFSFGDSLTDTGNLVELSISQTGSMPPHSAFPPYGRTYFRGPTGRYSDGRLVIDFLAEDLGFSYLQPFYGSNNGGWGKFQEGVNFAVAGATALNSSFLADKGIYNPSTNVSLGHEIKSFKDLLPSLCPSSSYCKEFLQNSLIVMGEIGGNDYNHAFLQGIKTEKIRQLVPLVVDTITSSINELVELGATTFLVPGNFPIGCCISMLTKFQGSNKDEYDPLTGCLPWLNRFSEYHNELLQRELEKLRNRRPDVNIIYIDNFNPTMRLYYTPKQFGFKETMKACCGTGGLYNYDPSRSCGHPSLDRSCDDPSSYISWDGIHYTEAVYKRVAGAVFEEMMNSIPGLSNLYQKSEM